MVRDNQKHSIIMIAHYYWLLIVVMTTTLSGAQSSEREWKLGFTKKVKWSEKCDFFGGDYAQTFDNSQAGKCEERCVADKRCTHFTSNPWMGCFLKTLKKPFVSETVAYNTICGFAIDRVIFPL